MITDFFFLIIKNIQRLTELGINSHEVVCEIVVFIFILQLLALFHQDIKGISHYSDSQLLLCYLLCLSQLIVF
jgi:hypothetical protein